METFPFFVQKSSMHASHKSVKFKYVFPTETLPFRCVRKEGVVYAASLSVQLCRGQSLVWNQPQKYF